MQRILVLGGTGFVGRDVCEKAWQLKCRVTLPTRRMENAKPVQALPWVDPVEADVHDRSDLSRLVRGHDAVVNLVAILHGSEADFHHVHVELVQKLIDACQAAGVQRLVHVSALGAAADSPSHYQRSKAKGEALLAASGLDVTVLRPSVVFGRGDQFLNMFARLQAWLPLIPLASADARFQPVWVEDLAQAIVNLLGDRDAVGSAGGQGRAPVYEACGPDVFTLRELVQLAGSLSGHPRPVVGLPAALAGVQARFMEWAPGKTLMSRDNLHAMQRDNIASGTLPGLAQLHVTPSAVSAVAPAYLQRVYDPMLARRRTAGRF